MTTENTMSERAQSLINQRLDVVDGALLGLLPRNERLAIVTQVEARLRELTAANPAVEANLAAAPAVLSALPQGIVPAGGRWAAATQKRRSRLALSSGVLGIVALVLLFVTPVAYLAVSVLGEALGETVAIGLLGTHIAAVTLGGISAVVLAIAAFVHLKRRRESLGGHGWAITGLCTGPLPMFLGALAAVYLGIEFVGLPMVSWQTATTSDECPADVTVTAEGYPLVMPGYAASPPPPTAGAVPGVAEDRNATAASSAPFRPVVEPAGHAVPATGPLPIEGDNGAPVRTAPNEAGAPQPALPIQGEPRPQEVIPPQPEEGDRG